MSHVSTIKIEVKDLAALKRAAANLGLVFSEGQSTYRWYGEYVGDYPLPEGYTVKELGRCDHAISVENKPGAYEVGVVKKKNGVGYDLLWDFFAGGHGLRNVIGTNGSKLIQQYAKEVARNKVRQAGFQVTEHVEKNGDIKLTCRRG